MLDLPHQNTPVLHLRSCFGVIPRGQHVLAPNHNRDKGAAYSASGVQSTSRKHGLRGHNSEA